MTAPLQALIQALLIGYLPGALIFRLPTAGRSVRAALRAEERVFWSIVLSVLLSSLVAIALAAANEYRFPRLIQIDAAVVAALLVTFRQRLRLGRESRGVGWSAVVPLLLVAGSAWFFSQVPPAEYVMGGKDPGVYVNAGIRIAQRGGIVVPDDTVHAVPALFRDLFFARTREAGYYSSRFMGFFLLDPTPGTVVAQFPAGFSTWVAIAYGLNGLTGARYVPVVCAVFGVLAVYMAGARLFGRTAAAAAAALLTLNVMQLWYARYPSAEILLQPLAFAGLLAYARAVHDDIAFFAPVAALLFGLGALTHLTGSFLLLAIAAGAVVDATLFGHRVRTTFWVALGLGTLTAIAFLWRYIPPYFEVPLQFVLQQEATSVAAAAAALLAAAGALYAARRLPVDGRMRGLTTGLSLVVCLLAAYAYFMRTPGGRLAPQDADSLRTFAAFYLTPIGLAAAVAGFVFAARTQPHAFTFLLLTSGFAVVFFYKIRIIPEHFWAARRFLAVILPGMLLLVGAAAFTPAGAGAAGFWRRLDAPGTRTARRLAGLVVVAAIGLAFMSASRALTRHVEYAGLIPHVEDLASTFGDEDLVLVESRQASDAHVLALPLAYIYARNVLVFASNDPGKDAFREFLGWALTKYRRVFFVGGGGGGTELLSRSITAASVRGERFQIPEYESPINAFPKAVRRKEFDLSVYELLAQPTTSDVVEVDLGSADDLYVRRFHAKETTPGGLSVRWSRGVSYVSLVGVRAEHRRLTIWMGPGGRPPTVEPAQVHLVLGERSLGTATVTGGLAPYRFDVPEDVASTLGRDDGAAVLRIETGTWIPTQVIGGQDTRDLGVVIDRVELR